MAVTATLMRTASTDAVVGGLVGIAIDILALLFVSVRRIWQNVEGSIMREGVRKERMVKE